MASYASKAFLEQLAVYLAAEIPLRAQASQRYTDWTRAAYDALKDFSKERSWSIHPADRCYAGEYLCDFTLHEDGYGCRIACESQWQHWRGNHQSTLDWAFDKLRGVKADVKLFIFEGSDEQWQNTIRVYLKDYAQLSTDEAFLAMHWIGQDARFVCSWWKPLVNGAQHDPIVFQVF